MFSDTQVWELIKKNYPSLTANFQKIFPSIAFKEVIAQLQWSINEVELKRGLHRLHCLHCLLQLKQASTETYPELRLFASTNQAQCEALLALLLIDSCKGCEQANKLLEQLSYKAPKDVVAFFLYSLQKFPTIYPIYNVIRSEAQQYLNSNIFCHMRHLQLGKFHPKA